VGDGADGRERILQAALLAFARQGDAATIRGIAALAEVSPALVQHHFVTKARLRDACDDYVITYFRQQVATGLDDMGIADANFVDAVERSSVPVISYLTRILADATPAAAEVFDALASLTERYLTTDGLAGIPDRASVLVAMQLGTMMLRPHLDRRFGTDSLAGEGIRRRNAAVLDLLNPTLADPAVMEQARKLVQSHSEVK